MCPINTRCFFFHFKSSVSLLRSDPWLQLTLVTQTFLTAGQTFPPGSRPFYTSLHLILTSGVSRPCQTPSWSCVMENLVFCSDLAWASNCKPRSDHNTCGFPFPSSCLLHTSFFFPVHWLLQALSQVASLSLDPCFLCSACCLSVPASSSVPASLPGAILSCSQRPILSSLFCRFIFCCLWEVVCFVLPQCIAHPCFPD